MTLPTLAADKANHFIYGLGVYLVASTLLIAVGGQAWHAHLVVLFVAGSKERSDQRSNVRAVNAGQAEPHSVELNDILATVAGGVAGWLCQAAPHASAWLIAFVKHLFNGS